MAWAKREYSKGEINRAGEVLAEGSIDFLEVEHALAVLNNWRSAHSFPLNAFQIQLRRCARVAYQHALVAQRLKRVPSIVEKLRREKSMALSTMQDIAGCRAVLDSSARTNLLRDMYSKSRSKHKLHREYDYIKNPKKSGYRSIHLVYHYNSDRTPDYNGYSIEIQIRSKAQHYWATAVETMGTFLQQPLKASVGPGEWLEYFRLVSSAFAIREKNPTVPNTPNDIKELSSQIRGLESKLDIHSSLKVFGHALEVTGSAHLKHAHYFLMRLRPKNNSLSVAGFTKEQREQATNAYLESEKKIKDSPGEAVVLVAVDSLEALRRAYPNYFLDTEEFFKFLKRAID